MPPIDSSRLSSSTSERNKGKILPQSTADVQAALAAVRARTAKLKLESPEGDIKLYAAAHSEARQPSSRQSRPQNQSVFQKKNDVLDQATLDSVSQYIGALNNSSYQVPMKDDDSFSSSSSGGNGGDNAHLLDISAMIDKVQQQNKGRLPAKLNAKTQIKKKNTKKSASGVGANNKQNLDLINAMINKVNQSQTIHKQAVANHVGKSIEPVSSDISSDDSSIGVGNVSTATQANLALYIDSLKAPKATASIENKVVPIVNKSSKIEDNDIPIVNKSEPSSIKANTSQLNQNQKGRAVNMVVRAENPPPSAANLSSRVPNMLTHNNKVEPFRAIHSDANANIHAKINAAPTFVSQNTSTVSSINVAKHTAARNKSPRVTASTYDDIKLESYIKKAKEIANKETPKIAEVEYIIIYARRDGVPIEPILKAFETDDKTQQHSNFKSPTKGLLSNKLTVSSDPIILNVGSSDEDDNESIEELEEKNISLEKRNVQKLVFYIYEAISLIENSILSKVCMTDLLERARDDDVDDAILREIFKNPHKHVKYESLTDNYVVLTERDSSTDEEISQESDLVSMGTNLNEENLLWPKNSMNTENVERTTGRESTNMEHPICKVSDDMNMGAREAEEVLNETRAENMIDMKASSCESDKSNNADTNDNFEAKDRKHLEGFASSFDNGDDNDKVLMNDNVDNPTIPEPHNTATPQVSCSQSHASSLSTPQHNSLGNVNVSKSQSGEFVGFLEREDSFTDEQRYEQLDPNEKYVYNKIKQLDRAKQIAKGSTGRAREVINEDGSKSIVAIPPKTLNAVKATKLLRKRRILKDYPSIVPGNYLQQWKIAPKQRVVGHPNYRMVQMDTFESATLVTNIMDPSDDIPWEEKDVKQFFLRDSDITQANWFGDIHPLTLNVRLSDPVEQPSTVVMDVVTFPRKWAPEWYLTWYTRKHNPNREGEKRKTTVKPRKQSKLKKKKKSKRSSRSRRSSHHYDQEEEEEEIDIPEVPEIGRLYTLRFRGEKASLVHLDNFVSYLSQSRWKQKYFPNKGIFSFD